MKKLAIVGTVALSLALTACGGQSFNDTPRNDAPQYSQSEMDPNNRSAYNDSLYCNGNTYIPLPGDEYQCADADDSSIILLPHTSRSMYTTAPKPPVPTSKPVAPIVKAPVQAPKPAAPAAPKPAAPKPAAPAAPKPAAPAPKAPAPAPKTGK